MKNIFLSLLILACAAPSALAGGPWTQNKNEGIFIANISPVIYKSYSAAEGGQVDLWRRVTEVSTQAYFELGLTDRLMLMGNLVLRYVGTSSKTFDSEYFNNFGLLEPDRLFGMGNSSIGLKYRFTDKSFLFSASFNIEVPGSSEKLTTGLRTGYDDWTFLPGIHMGQGFSNGIYYLVEGAFAFHTDLSDEYRIRGEFGYNFRKPLVMAVAVNVKQSLNNRTPGESTNYKQTGLYLNDQEWIAWEVKFIHEVTEDIGWTAALAGGATTTLIARTPVISFGMYYKWKGRSFEESAAPNQ